MFLLVQNANEFVDIQLLTFSYFNVNLVIVMIISITIGAMFGAVFMAFNAIQARSEVRKIRQQNKTLTSELEKLRNASIDEIPAQVVESDVPNEKAD
jgi:hypothetical protein